MNNQAPPHKITDVASAIEDELSTFAISLIKRKPQAERDPSRINLAVVGGAAFLMLTLLDLISAVVVGSMTNILYGLLVFVIGVGALAIDEAGYFWAYSSKWQKITSGFDAFVGITSTLLVGMIAAGLYAVKKFGIADTSGWQSYIEIGTMVSLVLIGTTHAFLWIIWVLIDEGVKMMQTYNQGKAQNKTLSQWLINCSVMSRTTRVVSCARNLKISPAMTCSKAFPLPRVTVTATTLNRGVGKPNRHRARHWQPDSELRRTSANFGRFCCLGQQPDNTPSSVVRWLCES